VILGLVDDWTATVNGVTSELANGVANLTARFQFDFSLAKPAFAAFYHACRGVIYRLAKREMIISPSRQAVICLSYGRHLDNSNGLGDWGQLGLSAVIFVQVNEEKQPKNRNPHRGKGHY
jgi:hypothetical protein